MRVDLCLQRFHARVQHAALEWFAFGGAVGARAALVGIHAVALSSPILSESKATGAGCWTPARQDTMRAQRDEVPETVIVCFTPWRYASRTGTEPRRRASRQPWAM